MVASLLGTILLLALPVGPAQPPCTDSLSVSDHDELPIGTLNEAEANWTEGTVPARTLRSTIQRLRSVRRCLRSRPSTSTNALLPARLLYWESLQHAGLQQFDAAFATLDSALTHLHRLPRDRDAARARWEPRLHTKYAFLHYLLGNLSPSIEHYLKAYRTTPDSNVDQQAEHLINVGILHQRTQDYRSARYYFDRAERTFRSNDRTPETAPGAWARLRHTQADLLLEETLNTSFETDALERVRRLSEEGRSAARPGTEQHARLSILLSESLGYLGAHERAYQLNESVRAFARASGDDRFQAFALLKLGVLHIQTDRWTQADTVLHRSLDLMSPAGDFDTKRRLYRALGRLHELQEEWAAAERYYRSGIEVIEEYRESLTASQWSMTALSQWQDVHLGLVRVLLAQDAPRAALNALDRTRARHLRDLRTQARLASSLPSDQRVRFDSLTQALTTVRTRLARATPSSPEEARLRDRETELIAARQSVLDLKSTGTRPSLSSVQATLRAQDRALVSYYLDDPWPVYNRTPRSRAFIVTGDTLRTVPLPTLTQDSVRAQVERISPLFSAPGPPKGVDGMHFDLRPLHQLQEQLYAPVAAHLPPDVSLSLVPDGPMFHVPPSTWVTAMPGGRYAPAEARYLLHERPVTLRLATSLVADTTDQALDRTTFNPSLAAFGVSRFDTLRAVPAALRSSMPAAARDTPMTLPSLPGVQKEIETVGGLIDGAQTATDRAATETAVRRACRRAGVVHLASHAFVHPTAPLQNAFLFRPDSSSSPPTDGVLFLHELRPRTHRIPLVVLSGCSTAQGTLHGGEGMAGLQYAFRAMGARATVSNLWPAADHSSVTLMDRFYRHLRDGVPKDEALRQAKLDYLDSHPSKASPFFWAPTVLYGSPQPLSLQAPSLLPSWAWGLLGAGVLVLLGGALYWIRPALVRSISPDFSS